MSERVGAYLATGFDNITFDEGRFYALLEFSTDDGPMRVALPPEFLARLAEAALAAAPQTVDLGNEEESVQAFNASEGTVTPVGDGRVVLRMAFGRNSEIRFLLPAGGAAQLAQALQGAISPEKKQP